MRALAIAALVLPGWILAGAFLVTEYRMYGPELMEHMFLDASGLTILFHLLILLAPLASTTLGVFVYDRFRLMEGFRELSFRYLDFYENAPYGYHSIGPDMVFQDVNDTWLEMLGYVRFSRNHYVWTPISKPSSIIQKQNNPKMTRTNGKTKNLKTIQQSLLT